MGRAAATSLLNSVDLKSISSTRRAVLRSDGLLEMQSLRKVRS